MRVSSHDQRADLDRQLARLSTYAAGHKLHVVEAVADVGSGLNGRKLLYGRRSAGNRARSIERALANAEAS
jgi:hypothetical protein